MRLKPSVLLCALILGSIAVVSADNVELPIKRVSLFSSGVGYFERAGEIEGSVNLTLPFETSAMDDALKSLIVYDPASDAPIVSYTTEDLQKTLSELKVNLSGNPSVAQILHSLKGAELEVYAPDKIVGKIIGTQVNREKNYDELSLFVDNNIKVVSLSNVTSYRFTDQKISQDLARALDIILNSKQQNVKNLNLYLPSSQTRPVSIGYIIPAPVWKAAYRLDLSGKNPFLQGWAIVDNAGDSDWKDVELSLVVGRLVSFTQPLYAPYFQKRPVLPLSIAGVAQARNYDAGFKESEIFYEMAAAPRQKMFAADSIADTNYDMTSSKSAGEHFVFTLKNPISLERRQSAMFPFIQGDLKARKISIFTHIQQGVTANPAIGAEITNTLGLKLPAGAISVYDGGSYAGDALIDFLADGEKRFVSYGDDLTVKGIVTHSSKAVFDSIKISKGVISITEKVIYEKAYAIKNSDKADKNIILEHPIMGGAKLIEPSKYAEKTASSYRFEFSVGAGKELKYGVKEEKPNISSTRIADMDYSALTLFSTNQNFSKPVKDALAKAVKLMSDVSVQKEKLSKARLSLQDKSSEQDRIRKNIDAVGKESAVGKDYIKKLTALDDEIVKAYRQISLAELSAYEAEGAFKDYIANLEI